MRAGFRRRDARAIYELHAGPNMTPMVDVVMVILIFFMATTVLLGPEVLLRTAAEPDAAESDAPASALGPVVLTVSLNTQAGRTAATGLGLTGSPLNELEPAARSLFDQLGAADPRVVVESGPGVPWGDVVRTQDALRRAGFTKLSLR